MITPQQLAASGTEHGHQAALFAWRALPEIRTKYPQLKWLHAIPNGGWRGFKEGGRLKAEGVKPGIADIFLPYRQYVPNNTQYFRYRGGLYIELKIPDKRTAKNGGATLEQLEFGKDMIDAGYAWYVCHGWEDARNRIVNYLEGI